MRELSFILSLKNKLSGPLGQAGKSVDSFANRTRGALGRLTGGVAGLWATTKTLTSILKPASDVKSALDELGTRNVGADALEQLRRQAGQFSTDFGVSATDFIGSVTAIRSAIQGLRDDELPGMANAVNTLAVAMKASGADAASYISDLSSTFTTEAAQMGNVAFAEAFASKTAWLVKNTGQDMAKIRELLKGAKGVGGSYGIDANEQLAVLGNLGAAMGNEAGGVYEAFVKNARAGARELGMSFTDAQGQLLAFPDILDRLQSKYGQSITGNVRLQEKLNKAFGKGASALIRTWGSSDKLRKNIQALQGTQGLAGAKDMAARLSDIWARMGQSGERIRNAFGAALLPVFEPLMAKVVSLAGGFARWLEMFPNITRWLGYVATAFMVLTGLASMLAIASGVKLVVGVLGLGKALVLITGPLKLFNAALLLTGKAFMFLFSPVGLVIFIIAAVGVAVWQLVKHWDTLKEALMNTAAFQAVAAAFGWVADVVAEVWQSVTAGWDSVVGYFASRSPLEVFSDFAQAITGVFTGLWDYLKSSFGQTWNWIASRLNKIPGVSIDLKEMVSPVSDVPAPPRVGPLPGMEPPQFERGGAIAAVTHQTQNRQGTRIGQVNIYPQDQETFDALLESRELAAP